MNDHTKSPLPDAVLPTARTLSEVAFDQGRKLAKDPNVVAVGHGIKLAGGRPSGTALVYFVREKLAVAAEIAARGSFAVPASVEGFATDVVGVGGLSAAAADRARPAGSRGAHVAAPLIGGTATMGLGKPLPGPGGYGTLGGLCFDTATNQPLLLSNAHVWGATVGTEVVQPVTPAAVLGAAALPATEDGASHVITRIPSALAAPVVFANSVAQTYLLTGGAADPLAFGQAATPVAALSRTESEQVTVDAPAAGLPPAGRRLSPTVGWAYQRLSSAAVATSSSAEARTITRLLQARRLFTNAASYTSGQTVNLYAEIVPVAGAATAASAHFPVVYLHPVLSGDRFIPRLLKPTARQTPTAVVTQFTGFPAPARAGAVRLPFTVQGVFTVDSTGPGTFQTATAGTLPAGTLALKLPAAAVRVFVPPGAEVVLDIDIRTASGFAAQAVNSAGDPLGTVSVPAPGANGRTLVTASASEIVELRLSGADTAVVYGVKSTRSSPETTPPLCYSGSIGVSALSSGRWGASLFVQALDGGLTESANVIETAIGMAALINDCFFDVA